MISALQNAARGLRDAETRFDGASAALARLGAAPSDARGGDAVDPSAAVGDLVAAGADVAANAAVLRSADRMSRRLLDVQV